MIWLEEFHINKYVRQYDARAESRYLKPPEFKDVSVGDKIMVRPVGRYKAFVAKNILGKYGIVEEVLNVRHKHFGRYTKVRLVTGKVAMILEAGLRKV